MLKLRQCEICGEDLELLCRMDQIYCSKECNQRAYRIRKKERALARARAEAPTGVQEPSVLSATVASSAPTRREQPVSRAKPALAAPRPADAVVPPTVGATPQRSAARAMPVQELVPTPPSSREPPVASRARELAASPQPPRERAPSADPAPAQPLRERAPSADPAPAQPRKSTTAQQWYEILHPPSTEPRAARTLASERVRFEPLRQEMARVPEAVSYMLGEPVPKRLVPIWHPEPGRPILRLDGSVSDRPFQLRPDFEPPVAPKSGLYAIKLLDAEGRELKLPLNLIRGILLDVDERQQPR